MGSQRAGHDWATEQQQMLKEYGNDLQNGNIRKSINNLPRERTIIGKNYFFKKCIFWISKPLPRATTNKERITQEHQLNFSKNSNSSWCLTHYQLSFFPLSPPPDTYTACSARLLNPRLVWLRTEYSFIPQFLVQANNIQPGATDCQYFSCPLILGGRNSIQGESTRGVSAHSLPCSHSQGGSYTPGLTYRLRTRGPKNLHP